MSGMDNNSTFVSLVRTKIYNAYNPYVIYYFIKYRQTSKNSEISSSIQIFP